MNKEVAMKKIDFGDDSVDEGMDTKLGKYSKRNKL
jgi:hypothetical protein